MENLNIEQILEKQNILELKKIVDQKLNVSEIKLVQYLAGIFNQKKEINIDFLKLLLQTSIDKKSATRKGLLPSHLATLFGDAKVTKVFIDNGFDMNEKVEFILYTARFLEPKTICFDPENKSFGELKEPETRRVPKNEDKKYISSFGTAFENYDSENIKLLIENGADIHEANYKLEDILKQIDWSKSDALCKAIENNDTEVVGLLLKNGFDIKKLDINANMQVPIEYGNLPLIKVLIEYGLDVNWGNINFGTLLELCSIQISNDTRFYDMAKFLIDKGADVNIGSPLMASLNNKRGDINDQIAKLLIKNGADVNYTDHKGKSILIDTCGYKMYGNRYELIQLLIDNGVNINYQDQNGNTALMMIEISLSDEDKMMKVYEDGTAEMDYKADVVLSSEKIMKLLIDNGADINAKNNMGMTPLMKYSMENNHRLVKILLENGADVNAKSEMTAFDLAQSEEIKNLIKDTKNNNPQKLVKLLSNFTLDTPFKLTTHLWEDSKGELFDRYSNFDKYLDAVKEQFEGMKNELEELSPNLYRKISAFLIETTPNENYSWCTKAPINIGWSSLEGLKEHCDSGKLPKDFKLPKPIFMGRKQIATFGEIVDLFKQEIEVKATYHIANLPDLEFSKRDFYTDTQKFSTAIAKIFDQMRKRKKYPQIVVTNKELLEDRSIEIKITQVGSFGDKDAESMLKEVNDGDFADLKESLVNLCDWSIESSYEDESFRVNFLHSNNVKDIEPLQTKPRGFTHILRFYK